jgi:hypothetical protein
MDISEKNFEAQIEHALCYIGSEVMRYKAG